MPVPSSPDRFESHIDRLIREAAEDGHFDDLAGQGEPLPGAGRVDDPLWWVRSWVERNRLRDLDQPDGPFSGPPRPPNSSS